MFWKQCLNQAQNSQDITGRKQMEAKDTSLQVAELTKWTPDDLSDADYLLQGEKHWLIS